MKKKRGKGRGLRAIPSTTATPWATGWTLLRLWNVFCTAKRGGLGMLAAGESRVAMVSLWTTTTRPASVL